MSDPLPALLATLVRYRIPITKLREEERKAYSAWHDHADAGFAARDAIRDPALVAAVLMELSQMFPIILPLLSERSINDIIAAILRRVKA